MRRFGPLVLLLLAGCRACSIPRSEEHTAIVSDSLDSSDGARVSTGPLSLVLPAGWSPTDREWPIPEGATLLGKFGGEAPGLRAKGLIVVLRASRRLDVGDDVSGRGRRRHVVARRRRR